MSSNPYQSPQMSYGAYAPMAAAADEWERTAFIRRTYLHLAGAVALFVLIETLIFAMVPEQILANTVRTLFGGWNWFLVLLAFMGVSSLANYWAQSGASAEMQYLGLGLYVVAEAIIFVPLLYLANELAPKTIPAAGLLTLVTFGGLTGAVMITKADVTWIGKYLWWGGILALGIIAAAIIFQFALGVWFSAAMIGLASGYILYQTSAIVHQYRTDQHVAASLALFASVALLFWYILQLLMSFSRD